MGVSKRGLVIIIIGMQEGQNGLFVTLRDMRTKLLLWEYPKEVLSLDTEFPIRTSSILVGIRFFYEKLKNMKISILDSKKCAIIPYQEVRYE